MIPRQSLTKLHEEIIKDTLRMASLVEQSIYDSVRALIKQDSVKASQVIMGDETIDDLYHEIEEKCVRYIATQQPIAYDLRSILTCKKVLASLERIGDYSVAIARATMCICGQPTEHTLDNIFRMATLVRRMLKDGLDAFVEGDVEKAKHIGNMDDEVDYIFAHVFRDLLLVMEKDGRMILPGAYLLYVNRYLERIADHATTIGDAVIYQITGKSGEIKAKF
ncbi:MAG TPA: phosphate signaling complex protein PhoU [Clostridia bacterium]|nr:phosphate signaling complex protein PhoU [Clostridia bacterium]